eukprot:Gregarina_sp_Poly_1__11319@NODE_947_length_5591_cov_64_240043_g671_i0_p2_GENE_NODE_947_length_5591_cov_64_240043_g671_i0NODE_947_length_5591_cov_64_240043_g671_i0_p2_ORF_typecomplete_len332_score51_40Glu_cyclase_2/PF05096_12/1_1e37SGL/PF08450_12/16SGL/PF08450_12/2_9ThiCassociated/PF13667_6/0_18_NODE_947_length_5591_cov_64_240043_g671_i024793474
MKSIFVCFAGIVCLVLVTAAPEYRLNPGATAVFNHVGQPFTQGFEAVKQESCDGDIGILLDDCLETDSKERAICLQTVLNDCVRIYETSGLYDESYIQAVNNFESGMPSVRTLLPPNVFAEGLTVMSNGTILVGTWKEQRLIMLEDAGHQDFRYVDEYWVRDPPEIWGIAHSQSTLWLTSGDHYLYVYDLPLQLQTSSAVSIIDQKRRQVPELKWNRRVPLTLDGRFLTKANELDFNPYTGTLWANVWMKHRIYELDPDTGRCLGFLNLASYKQVPDKPGSRSRRSRGRPDSDKVWNGVSFISKDWVMFTGKMFDYVYISKLLPSTPATGA